MAELIKADTASELWIKSKGILIEKGEAVDSGRGQNKELLHVMIELSNPMQRWMYNRFPPMNISFALAELFWILNGSNDVELLDTWNKNLKNQAEDKGSPTYHGAYGHRLRSQYGIDQIDRAYLALKANPNSRQVVMQIWDPRADMPNETDGQPISRDIPCNICSLLKIRNDKLEWTQIMRSNDIFLGLPQNLVQFTSLQEIMAGWLGIEIGSYHHLSDSFHLYEKYVGIKQASTYECTDTLYNTDRLAVSHDDFIDLSLQIYEKMNQIATADAYTPESELLKMADLDTRYEAYSNIMRVIAAYPIAKKLGRKGIAKTIMQDCTNTLFNTMWSSWAKEIYLF
jgi:thymidylate synthase